MIAMRACFLAVWFATWIMVALRAHVTYWALSPDERRRINADDLIW